MCKNNEQFQVGYSLIQLFQDYGTEAQCHESLFKSRWPTGFNRPECGCHQYCFLKARKLYQCNKCYSGPKSRQSFKIASSIEKVDINE
jgi:hypothetical protein